MGKFKNLLILLLLTGLFFFFLSAMPAGAAEKCTPDIKVTIQRDCTVTGTGITPVDLKIWVSAFLPEPGELPLKIGDLTYVNSTQAIKAFFSFHYNNPFSFIEVSAILTVWGDTIHKKQWQVDINEDVLDEDGDVNFETLVRHLSTLETDVRDFFHSIDYILYEKLPIVSVDGVEFDKKVVNAKNPGSIQVKVINLNTPYGAVTVDIDQTWYCLSMYLKDQTNKTGKVFFTAQEILDKKFEFGMEGWPKSCNNVDRDPCARPVAQPVIKVESAFGIPVDKKNSEPEILDKPKLTLDCPVKVDHSPPVFTEPGETVEIPLRVIDYKGDGIGKVKAENIFISPDTFGRLSHETAFSYSGPPDSRMGFFEDLYLKVFDDASDMASVRCTICQDTPEALLGENEDGEPLYYPPEQTLGEQDVRIMPEIRFNVVGDVNINSRMLAEDSNAKSSHTSREKIIMNQRMALDFDAKFSERIETRVKKDDIGFQGYRITYIGKAETPQITLESAKPRHLQRQVSGWVQRDKCGKVNYNYNQATRVHTMQINDLPETIDVYYHHFIPDKGSALQKHPLEGLSFNSFRESRSVFKYSIKLQSTSLEFKGKNRCTTDYKSVPMPDISFPLALDQYMFPASCMAVITNGCYGLGQIFENMVKDKYRDFFRKLKTTDQFDSFEIIKNISLDQNDTAMCWEPGEQRGNVQGSVNGRFYITSTAEVTKGQFNLELVTPRDLLMEQQNTDISSISAFPTEFSGMPETPGPGPSAFQDDLPAQPSPEDLPAPDVPSAPGDDTGVEEGELFFYDDQGNKITPEQMLENL